MTQDWNAFLTSQGLAAGGSHFGSQTEELRAAKSSPVVCPLIDLGLLRASGADAAEFLHNLLTNDIKGITPDVARFAGLCTPKGRLLALFLVWRNGEDFLLALPAELLPAIHKRMSMYILRAKVKLTDESPARVLLGTTLPGFAGASVADLPRFGVRNTAVGQWIRLDPARSLIVCDPSHAPDLWPQLTGAAGGAHPVGLEAWRWLEIVAGQPQVVAATQEAFVPQMLNMEQPAVAGVSFTKGCYPGQEIVARTQYLGKVKRRMFRARLPEGSDAAQPGTPVFAAETGDQAVGALVSVAAAPEGGRDALVCVQSSAVESGAVHLGAPAGATLAFLPLPYELS